MDKLTKGIIIGLVLGLVIGTLSGYIIHSVTIRNFTQGRGNFQIDEKTKAEITSFFESTSDITEINTYCVQNRMYCSYYCRTISPSSEICNQIMNSSQTGGKQWSP